MKKITSLTCILFGLVFNTSVFAELKSINVGLKIGAVAPELTALNTAGKKATLKQLMGRKGLIINFYRSADWCHFCQGHLMEFNQFSEKFTALGYGQAGVSYDSIDILKGFSDKNNIKYPLLSDLDVQTVLAYDIVNRQYKPGDEHYGIPYPGVVVINQQGKIIHSYFFDGYKRRVKFDQLYEQLN